MKFVFHQCETSALKMNFWLGISSPPHTFLSGIFSDDTHSNTHIQTLIHALLYGKIRTKSIFNVCEFSLNSYNATQCLVFTFFFYILQSTLYISALYHTYTQCKFHIFKHILNMGHKISYIFKIFSICSFIGYILIIPFVASTPLVFGCYAKI